MNQDILIICITVVLVVLIVAISVVKVQRIEQVNGDMALKECKRLQEGQNNLYSMIKKIEERIN